MPRRSPHGWAPLDLACYNRRMRSLRVLMMVFLCAALAGCGAAPVDGDVLPMPVLRYVFPTPDFYGLAYENVALTAETFQTSFH